MDVISMTTLSDSRRTLEPSTLRVTLSSQERDNAQSSSIFSGFAGLLTTILLVITAACILWSWNKRKKRQVPYLPVTAMPSLTLPRPRQRAKNIYDLLPQRQEELGRHQPRGTRMFSAESLLSRNSDSTEHMPFQAAITLQRHTAHIHAMGYAVGVYDNATVPQMCRNLTPSTHYVNVRASRDISSTSSEESNDYVNVPPAEEIAETLTSNDSLPESLFVLPSAQELDLTEKRHEACGDASDCTNFWSPGTKDGDPLSDGEDSSQTSNDYVNMTGLDLEDLQEELPWVVFQCCRDYENVPPVDPNGSQQQTEDEVTSSNTGHKEGRTDGPGTDIHPLTRNSLSSGYCVAFQPSILSESSQMKHEEEMSNEDPHDYENVLTAKLGDSDPQQGPATQLPPGE
uniref:Lymphocyte transmembrane adaptor 1 n=1 Tax=Sciurus vulgaris TaxID=55149 RepID=A0A8D2B3A9_SCIVU